MEESSRALSPLAVAALALLVEGPMHPYEMYQEMLKRKDDRLVKVRPGSLYHTIDRLARHGMAEVAGTDRGGNRPERTTYRVTDEGRSALQRRLTAMLRERAEEYPEFPLALSQAHNLPAEEAVRLLETRIAAMRESLDALGLSAQHVEARDIPEKYWIEVGYQRAVLRAELDWLEHLLERITTGRLDW
ncbi:PadR family transcriptional regulator [Naasia aerilata]|uniref:PadR family transcriptional regulator n=1 Tax=Naasia aerilata TaxID=1162966 RepID=A0ABM8GAN7_9MICO|nr:PadR family transcriptional regulator [Naasia aerilata]BDZ45265.1 PadR family transcriptional regulator [Naasia aerilata]